VPPGPASAVAIAPIVIRTPSLREAVGSRGTGDYRMTRLSWYAYFRHTADSGVEQVLQFCDWAQGATILQQHMNTLLPRLWYIGDRGLNAEKPAEAREMYEE
jgi:hypothetical protein